MDVLLIEDSPADVEIFKGFMCESGEPDAVIHVCGSFAKAISFLSTHSIDVVVLDLYLPDGTGVGLINELKESFPRLPIIVCTSLDDDRVTVASFKAGAEDCIVKAQMNGDMLIRSLRYAIQRKKEQEAFREASLFLNSIFENIPNIIFVKEAKDLRFVRFNKSAEEFFGLSSKDVLGKNDYDFFPHDQADFFTSKDREVLSNKKIVDIAEEPVTTKLHGVRYLRTVKVPILDSKGQPQFLLGISEDITGKKNSEKALRDSQEQLYTSQKMEAVGRLAGGIAHDFNNLLGTILGFCRFVLQSTPEDDPRRSDIKEIIHAGDRASALTKQLLAFGRKQMLRPAVFDLNGCITNFSKIINRTVNEDVEVGMHLTPDPNPVRADRTQIEQVILNLAINASDAMPKGGRLTISTFNETLAMSREVGKYEIPAGEYVVFSLSDTGTGMDEHTVEHIFEPFFTTKEIGKGTGLGLATVYGIIKQSGGYVVVNSEKGRGSIFSVYLPKVTAANPEAVAAIDDVEVRPGNETILLVEDEKPLREIMTRVLQSHGYTVLAAKDGAEALQLCHSNEKRFKLMISDVMIPGLKGIDLANKVKEMNPGISIIFISGYAGDVIGDHGILESDINFMPKPFDPDKLLVKARELLDARR